MGGWLVGWMVGCLVGWLLVGWLLDPTWELAGARFDVRFAMGPNGAGQNTLGGPQGPVAIWRCRGFPIHCRSQDAGRPLRCRSIMVHCPPTLGSYAVNCGRFPLRSGTLPSTSDRQWRTLYPAYLLQGHIRCSLSYCPCCKATVVTAHTGSLYNPTSTA